MGLNSMLQFQQIGLVYGVLAPAVQAFPPPPPPPFNLPLPLPPVCLLLLPILSFCFKVF